jgi:hypothetical protein
MYWSIPVNLATWEVETRRITVQASLDIHMTFYSKITEAKGPGPLLE